MIDSRILARSRRLIWTATLGYSFLNSANTSGRICRQVPSLAPTTISPRGILLKDLACRGERYLAAAAVKQSSPNLFFQRPNLRGNGRLRTKALLRSPRKTSMAGDLQEGFELVKIH